jgi:hypothetical protein
VNGRKWEPKDRRDSSHDPDVVFCSHIHAKAPVLISLSACRRSRARNDERIATVEDLRKTAHMSFSARRRLLDLSWRLGVSSCSQAKAQIFNSLIRTAGCRA